MGCLNRYSVLLGDFRELVLTGLVRLVRLRFRILMDLLLGLRMRRCSRGKHLTHLKGGTTADQSSMKGLGDPDEALVKKYLDDLDAVLKVYDGILAKQAYLTGEEVSLVDIFHIPYGKMVFNLGGAYLWEKHGNVGRWFDKLVKRDTWVKANQS